MLSIPEALIEGFKGLARLCVARSLNKDKYDRKRLDTDFELLLASLEKFIRNVVAYKIGPHKAQKIYKNILEAEKVYNRVVLSFSSTN